MVGRAAAAPLDFAQALLTFVVATPPGFKAPLVHDLQRGSRIELDWLAGKVVELGRRLKIPTPANGAVYAALKLHRQGRS